MNFGKTILAQLTDFLPICKFHQCVQRYHGHYKMKSFSCRGQFLKRGSYHSHNGPQKKQGWTEGGQCNMTAADKKDNPTFAQRVESLVGVVGIGISDSEAKLHRSLTFILSCGEKGNRTYKNTSFDCAQPSGEMVEKAPIKGRRTKFRNDSIKYCGLGT